MKVLRTVLYLSAAAHVTGGLALLLAPGAAMSALGQAQPDLAWIRLVGIQGTMTGLMQVIIGHRVETLWWFSWTFVFGAVASMAVFAWHAIAGVPAGSAVWPWWALAAFGAAGVVTLLAGLALAGLERPAE